jgi:hypothetical protein
MEPTPQPQMSLSMMLVLVACVAVNFWLFRVGIFWGVVALNITKHVAIAVICQMCGVNRKPPSQPGELDPRVVIARPEPSSN